MVQKVLDNIVAFLLLAGLEVSVGLKDLLASLAILSVHMDSELVWPEPWFSLLFNWRIMVIESIRWIDLVTVYDGGVCILRELVIWLSELLLSMGIGAVFTELTLALLDPELALLGLIVIVLNIHHFKNKIGW